MADPDRNPTAPVSPPPALEPLLRAPQTHDFFVALRLLQTCLRGQPIGTALTPGREEVRLRQSPSLAFAPAAISRAAWDGEKRHVDLRLCFSGLLGPNGPMPLHLTEYVLDRLQHEKDGTLAAFLDVFHQRFYSLLFRAWALNQPTVALEETAAQRHVHYLRCLVGLGTAGATGRDSVPDAAWVYYGGWLAGLSRSPAGLGAILSDYFGVPVEVRSFEGMWLDLPADSRCQLGAARSTGVLGVTCVAGERMWVTHLKFRIRFGPLAWADYERLLPGGAAFRQVSEWVRAYLGEELFWELQLVLRRKDVPACQLGGGRRLGWTTWVGSPPQSADVDDLVLQAA
jgi:type VI secretion system protein ImpH